MTHLALRDKMLLYQRLKGIKRRILRHKTGTSFGTTNKTERKIIF